VAVGVELLSAGSIASSLFFSNTEAISRSVASTPSFRFSTLGTSAFSAISRLSRTGSRLSANASIAYLCAFATSSWRGGARSRSRPPRGRSARSARRPAPAPGQLLRQVRRRGRLRRRRAGPASRPPATVSAAAFWAAAASPDGGVVAGRIASGTRGKINDSGHPAGILGWRQGFQAGESRPAALRPSPGPGRGAAASKERRNGTLRRDRDRCRPRRAGRRGAAGARRQARTGPGTQCRLRRGGDRLPARPAHDRGLAARDRRLRRARGAGRALSPARPRRTGGAGAGAGALRGARRPAGAAFRLPEGFAAATEAGVQAFPEQADGVRRYFRSVEAICDAFHAMAPARSTR